ncbi:MAG: histidinol-phosphatase [Anaerolineales bacterium]
MTNIIPLDYHIHTNYSCDCEQSMDAMARAAVAQGIRQIGFSDHFDPIPLDHCHGYFQPEAWWEAHSACQDLFIDTLSIQAGVEIGEPHRFPVQTEELLSGYPWDYALGSLHWVGDQMVFEDDYFKRTPEQAYTQYFVEMQKMVAEGDFDIIAHMDVVKRYGFDNYGEFEPDHYEREIRAVLRIATDRGLAIEVNTSTLRRPVGETSPARKILRWFREEGGQHVTLGSDAHQTEHVGFGLDRALQNLKEAGFSQLTGFERRKPYLFDIEAGPRA